MTQHPSLLRASLALACLLAATACSGPLLEHDAAQGPGSDSQAASAVHGQATTGQFQ